MSREFNWILSTWSYYVWQGQCFETIQWSWVKYRQWMSKIHELLWILINSTGGSSASDWNFSPVVTMSPSLSNMITQFKMDSCQLYEDRGQVSLVCILLRTDHYCESSCLALHSKESYNSWGQFSSRLLGRRACNENDGDNQYINTTSYQVQRIET